MITVLLLVIYYFTLHPSSSGILSGLTYYFLNTIPFVIISIFLDSYLICKFLKINAYYAILIGLVLNIIAYQYQRYYYKKFYKKYEENVNFKIIKDSDVSLNGKIIYLSPNSYGFSSRFNEEDHIAKKYHRHNNLIYHRYMDSSPLLRMNLGSYSHHMIKSTDDLLSDRDNSTNGIKHGIFNLDRTISYAKIDNLIKEKVDNFIRTEDYPKLNKDLKTIVDDINVVASSNKMNKIHFNEYDYLVYFNYFDEEQITVSVYSYSNEELIKKASFNNNIWSGVKDDMGTKKLTKEEALHYFKSMIANRLILPNREINPSKLNEFLFKN